MNPAALAILFALLCAAPAWAQAAPAVPVSPADWWVPIVAAILVALWDIIKRKFNLVEPIGPPAPAPEPAPAPLPPAPIPQPVPSPTPILDIAKQLLPLLVPLVTTAVAEALKPKAEPSK